MNEIAGDNAAAPSEHKDEALKDAYFAELAALSERMIASFGKDFAMGALILAARHIATHSAS